MDKLNVILIIADQFRGDCLGAAGHPDVKTPHLDDLCSHGIRFTNAVTATPSCIPARVALFTGMSQENHCRVGYEDGVRWNYPHTLAETFAENGYQCHCSGKMHVHPLRNSMGYHSIDLHDGYLGYYRGGNIPYHEDQRIADDYFYWLKSELGANVDVIDTGIAANAFAARPWLYDEKYHPTRWVTDRGIDFLRKRDRDKPFFLTLSYVRPHPPFDAPQAFFDLYRNKELKTPLWGDWADEDRLKQDGRFVESATGPVDPQLQREAQIGYYAAISQLDYEYGRLMLAMNAERLNQSNTIVMFISDHGEMLCDHGRYRKCLPYKGSAGIPFVISSKMNDGILKTCDRLVELRDVMPTLLSLCGLEIPDTVDGKNVFSPNWDREYIHGEHTVDGGACHWIVTEKDKFVWFSKDGHRQYFDLEKDPEELHNGIADDVYEERISELEMILVRELSWREEKFVQKGNLIAGVPVRQMLSRSFRSL